MIQALIKQAVARLRIVLATELDQPDKQVVWERPTSGDLPVVQLRAEAIDFKPVGLSSPSQPVLGEIATQREFTDICLLQIWHTEPADRERLATLALASLIMESDDLIAAANQATEAVQEAAPLHVRQLFKSMRLLSGSLESGDMGYVREYRLEVVGVCIFTKIGVDGDTPIKVVNVTEHNKPHQ